MRNPRTRRAAKRVRRATVRTVGKPNVSDEVPEDELEDEDDGGPIRDTGIGPEGAADDTAMRAAGSEGAADDTATAPRAAGSEGAADDATTYGHVSERNTPRCHRLEWATVDGARSEGAADDVATVGGAAVDAATMGKTWIRADAFLFPSIDAFKDDGTTACSTSRRFGAS